MYKESIFDWCLTAVCDSLQYNR